MHLQYFKHTHKHTNTYAQTQPCISVTSGAECTVHSADVNFGINKIECTVQSADVNFGIGKICEFAMFALKKKKLAC